MPASKPYIALLFDALWSWVSAHESLLLILAGLSVLILVASLCALPWAVAALPEDYFVAKRRLFGSLPGRHPLADLIWRILKNVLGWSLILAGLLMLVLPGQGLLTLVVGLILSDFPGKFRLEQRLAAEPRVLAGLNWLRRRAGRAPLRAPTAGDRVD